MHNISESAKDTYQISTTVSKGAAIDYNSTVEFFCTTRHQFAYGLKKGLQFEPNSQSQCMLLVDDL